MKGANTWSILSGSLLIVSLSDSDLFEVGGRARRERSPFACLASGTFQRSNPASRKVRDLAKPRFHTDELAERSFLNGSANAGTRTCPTCAIRAATFETQEKHSCRCAFRLLPSSPISSVDLLRSGQQQLALFRRFSNCQHSTVCYYVRSASTATPLTFLCPSTASLRANCCCEPAHSSRTSASNNCCRDVERRLTCSGS